MPADVAVALLDGARLAAPLGERTGARVVATTPADHLEVAARIGRGSALVVGLAPVPWPVHADLHAEGSATLPAYTGVVSWHALGRLHELLARSIAPAVAAGAHVLVTAPDPGPDADPADLVFLSEVAEGISRHVELPSRSIAWRGASRTPTAVTALTSVVEVYGRQQVVECPVAPGTGADRELAEAAERLGARLTTVDLGRSALLDVLTDVVATVAGHEGVG